MKPDSHITIQHNGIVKNVDNSSVQVGISSSPACSGCHAEGYCGISGKEEKIVDIKGKYDVSPGDNVTIMMEQSTGYKAVVLSYLIPLVIIIFCLVILNLFSINELTAGLISILLLVPYFLSLYLFRKKISRTFTFTLKP
jgi:sigma-E factor negative regulatory protein RseC